MGPGWWHCPLAACHARVSFRPLLTLRSRVPPARPLLLVSGARRGFPSLPLQSEAAPPASPSFAFQGPSGPLTGLVSCTLHPSALPSCPSSVPLFLRHRVPDGHSSLTLGHCQALSPLEPSPACSLDLVLNVTFYRELSLWLSSFSVAIPEYTKGWVFRKERGWLDWWFWRPGSPGAGCQHLPGIGEGFLLHHDTAEGVTGREGASAPAGVSSSS